MSSRLGRITPAEAFFFAQDSGDVKLICSRCIFPIASRMHAVHNPLIELGSTDMNRILLAASIAAALSACATPPGRIKPIASSAPCSAADRTRLADISKVQASTATNDALGVFLIGLPVGSMGGGDHEAEIATLKGRCG